MYTAQGTLDRDTVIQEHGKLVRRLAAQMIARLPSNVEMDDLVQAGMIGLLDAQSRFDPSQGVQFETFATQRVKGAMLDELRGSDWVPRSVRKNQRTISQAVQVLEQKLQRAPAEAEIAAEMGLPIANYQDMLTDSRGAQLVYFDEYNQESDGEEKYLDRHLVDENKDPAVQLQDAQFRSALIEAIDRLPEREKLVMSMYYEQELNLKEIGLVLGVTESRVCQMHTQAIARLRTKIKAKSIL